MSKTRSVAFLAAMILLLAALPACKRSAVEFPDPFGPGSYYLTFDVFASPNVILTSDIRETAELRALVKYGGEPAAGQLVVFSILSGPGEFADYSKRIAAYTNQNGYAVVTYLSPTKSELAYDQTVSFYIHPQTSSPYFTWTTIDIRLLKGP